jgi:hypothetical protein
MESQTMTPLDGHSVEETLDVVEALWLESLEGNCEIFLAAAHYADLCSGEGLPAAGHGRVLPGMERSVQLGGAGTPRVAEFAAAAFGARLRMGAVGGRAMIADALDTRHRLPMSYARVEAREARVPWVRHVARRTRELSVEAARRVDAEMAELVDGRVPWSRFCATLEGRIVAADPEAAARREEDARREAFAKTTRSSEHGMKGFYLRGPAALVIRFEATVAFLAEALKALGDTDEEDPRRVKACLVMANPMQAVELLAAFAAHRAGTGALDDDPLPDDELPPDEDETAPDDPTRPEGDETAPADETVDDKARPGNGAPEAEPGACVEPVVPRVFRAAELPGWLARACDPTRALGAALLDWPRLLPRVNLYLHLAEETVDAARAGTPAGAVRWEGEGPITLQYVRDQLAPYHAFTITPVVDLAGQEPVDGYEIPARHRRAVRLRTPADCFPFAANLDPVDIDHTQAYQHASGPPGEQEAPSSQSRMGNYGPLGRFHHRIKTHGRWQVAQPFDGIYVWRDPHGHFYLVDHTGTRKVTGPKGREPRVKPCRPVVIELYRSEVTLDLDDLRGHAA